MRARRRASTSTPGPSKGSYRPVPASSWNRGYVRAALAAAARYPLSTDGQKRGAQSRLVRLQTRNVAAGHFFLATGMSGDPKMTWCARRTLHARERRSLCRAMRPLWSAPAEPRTCGNGALTRRACREQPSICRSSGKAVSPLRSAQDASPSEIAAAQELAGALVKAASASGKIDLATTRVAVGDFVHSKTAAQPLRALSEALTNAHSRVDPRGTVPRLAGQTQNSPAGAGRPVWGHDAIPVGLPHRVPPGSNASAGRLFSLCAPRLHLGKDAFTCILPTRPTRTIDRL